MGSKISVVVNTRNEERNLPYALRSVANWVDEIVVVDMRSTDRTLEVAEAFQARTFTIEPAGFVEPARAFAVSQATGDWILVLDADELVPEPLSRRFISVVEEDDFDIVACPFKTFLLGTALKGTGWGRHEVHQRFFRRGFLEFRDQVHSSPILRSGGRILDLAAATSSTESPADFAIHHFNYLGFHDFLDRLNRYTTIEAIQASQSDEVTSLRRALKAAGREFVWRFVRAEGFRDGWRGAYLSILMAMYRLVSNAKQQQLQLVGTEEEIEALYAQEAERLLWQYSHANDPSRSG